MTMSCVARFVVCAAAAAFAAGCATKETTTQADADRLVCMQERATGSIRPTTTCRTVAQIEQERQKAERDMNTVRQDSAGITDRVGR